MNQNNEYIELYQDLLDKYHKLTIQLMNSRNNESTLEQLKNKTIEDLLNGNMCSTDYLNRVELLKVLLNYEKKTS